LTLIRCFPLRRIRSDAELDKAIAVIDSLIDRPKLAAAESDYLDVLSDLVERYEEEHHAIEPASDAAMLQHLLDSKGVTQLAVAEATGIANTTLSAVINGKRRLTREHVARLARFFQVAPTVFAFETAEPGTGKRAKTMRP
jgi:HTH-type transcriptional regulator/antitoxin HigA